MRAAARLDQSGTPPTGSPEPDLVLDDYLAECRRLVTSEITALFAGRGHDLYDLMLDYPLREGKALRPTLAIACCRALGGPAEAVLPSAATLELYHNAFLIHDDIEDDSIMRRGEPTLHVDHGVPIAVNVGDAMLGLSLKPLLDNVAVVGLGPALRILRAVAHMTHESVEGQATELDWVRHNRWDLDDEDYIRMVVQKTGSYSFITPLQIGAMAANAPTDVIDELLPFGRDLSISFQIVDDVLNLRADPELYGKEIGGDLWEGKRTLILLHAVRSASPEDRERAISILARDRPASDGDIGLADILDRLVESDDLTDRGRRTLIEGTVGRDRPQKTHEDVRWLFSLVRRHRSIDYAAATARRYATRAADHLGQLDALRPSTHRRVLEELVDYVHRRTK